MRVATALQRSEARSPVSAYPATRRGNFGRTAHRRADLSPTCVLVSCFGLPFLGKVRIRWGFPFAKVTTVEQYRGGCRLRSWFVDVGGGESLFLRRRLANEFGLQVHPFRYSAAHSTMTEITARLQSFVESLASPVVHLRRTQPRGTGDISFPRALSPATAGPRCVSRYPLYCKPRGRARQPVPAGRIPHGTARGRRVVAAAGASLDH